MSWTPLTAWHTYQPMRCDTCQREYDGRDLGAAALCDREACPGPADRVWVRVEAVEAR